METKPWYQSLTVIASGVVAFLQVLPSIITQIDAAIPSIHLATNPVVIQVLSIIGVIVAIYGRLTAKTTLK